MREGLKEQQGRSDAFLLAFYRLLLLTRRRHRLPPQPFEWFQRIRDSLGECLNVRIALKGGQVIGGIMTLRYKDTVTYKYGGSDAAYHKTGAMPFLFWGAIEDAKRDGFRAFDLGRSNTDNAGLITFKQRWGASASTLTYFRYPASSTPSSTAKGWSHIAGRLVPFLPDALLIHGGKSLYRHLG
jgi:hypothetical protein